MNSVIKVGTYELFVDYDGLWVIRGDMFGDDIVRLSFEQGVRLSSAIQYEANRRCGGCGYTTSSRRHQETCPFAKAARPNNSKRESKKRRKRKT